MMDWGIRRSIMFHVRRRPADSQPRRRKKKPLGASNGDNTASSDREGPVLVEVTHSGDGGRRMKLGIDPIEVGSANTNSLQLFGPSIQARHCLVALSEGVCTVTPLHADALTFVNGHHITQPTILHNGSVVMFGRVASYRFVDSPSDGRYNLALSQSQLDSACLYESRSPTSQASWNGEDGNINLNQNDPANSNIKSEIFDENKMHIPSRTDQGNHFTQTKDLDMSYDCAEQNLESETKSNSSFKSTSQDQRSQKTLSGEQGQEAILPAVLEFPETHQETFLCQIIIELDVNVPHFKLAPVYTLYLCARYRASTHYRPELQPTERAHKLTIFLHHVSNLIYSVIQEQYTDSRVLAFWMANSSEFLHFLKSDRHISAFSIQAQEILAESVQTAFQNLVNCFRMELSETLNQFLSETIDHDSAAGLVLTVLGSAMALLRRCRVNAALTIQLFSQLFHYINVICFNTIVANSHMCTPEWGKMLTERLQLLELWAERQGLELAADCHLAKINQCAQFLQAPKTSVEEIQKLACSCFRLNSLQMSALLQQDNISRTLVDTVIRMAESVADELTRADGREVRLEESPELHLALLLPDDGFSCDVVRGIPSGLLDFLNPLQAAGMCRLAAQPTSIGLWTVYMHQFNARSPSAMSNKLPQPEVQVIKLHKNSNGMGLSIVAAKGAGQERLGIYIKSVVPGGAADTDDRLQAGDQLLRVDGQSLIGITQERAAEYLVRTGPIVTLEVAKQGAIYHGLATLLQQPSPIVQRGGKKFQGGEMSRMAADAKCNGQFSTKSQLGNSKSAPAINYSSNNTLGNSKSKSINCLVNNNEPGFYQNLSLYRVQNQSQPMLRERHQVNVSHSALNAYNGNSPNTIQQKPTNLGNNIMHQKNLTSPTSSQNNRPSSAYYQSSVNLNHPISNSSTTTSLPITMLSLNDNNVKSASCTYINTNGNSSTTLNPQLQHLHPQSSLTLNNRYKAGSFNYNRDIQSQPFLQMNDLMTPTMPNIADNHTKSGASIGGNSGLSTSQSLQNVTIITQPSDPMETSQQYHYQTNFQNQNQQYATKISGRISEEMPMRRNYQIDIVSDNFTKNDNLDQINHTNVPFNTQNSHQIEQNHQNTLDVPTKQQTSNHCFNPNTESGSKQHPSSNISRSQPNSVPDQHHIEYTPPLPPTTTHPLFKAAQNSQRVNYVASTVDPPKGGYFKVNSMTAHQPNFSGSNPWEREEREKEHEMRREHLRHWRDKQINELSNLPSRTSQQEEQLKTLVLERDFELRAQELEEQEDESEQSFEKEILRIGVPTNKIQTIPTNFRQTVVKICTQENIESSDHIPSISTPESQVSFSGNYQSQQTPTIAVQPKGILKNNRFDNSVASVTPSSPSKSQKCASFADEKLFQADLTTSGAMKNVLNFEINSNMEQMFLEEYIIQQSINNNIPPPPPPERNSSYIIMSQQQQKIRNAAKTDTHNQNQNPISSNLIENNNNRKLIPTMTNNNRIRNNQTQNSNEVNLMSPPSDLNASNTTIRDSKRVSFHDEENNFVPLQLSGHMENEKCFIDQPELQTICKNTDLSSESTRSLLKTTTPEQDVWNNIVQSTPGVIGAQEVYRDPRQRRLAEQQQKKQQRTSEAVPEKLSFKEKMKMFALESGEDHTPKDKLKISRAQRDIDAVN